jgi:hypothetical protein
VFELRINREEYKNIVNKYRTYEKIHNAYFSYIDNIFAIEQRNLQEKERETIVKLLTDKKNTLDNLVKYIRKDILNPKDNYKNNIEINQNNIIIVGEKMLKSLEYQIVYMKERKDKEFIKENANEKINCSILSQIIISADKNPFSKIVRFFSG